MRKALLIASMGSMLDNFNRNNIETLLNLGYQVTLASNFNTDEDSNSKEKNLLFISDMQEKGCIIKQLNFTRSLKKIGKQIQSYKEVKQLSREKFDLVHCNSPICSVITRLAFRKNRKKENTKVIYTAHGFHFYKGASITTWIVFYPLERLMSKYTDVLITINKEDYNIARKKLKAKQVYYVPGVGIDLDKINCTKGYKERLLAQLNLPNDSILLLSVGELNENKNHVEIIKSLPNLPNNVHYLVCGKGKLHNELLSVAKTLMVDKRLHLMGFCENAIEIMKSCDIFVFPSKREGLSVALMEAMASGLPCIVSNIRGNNDLVADEEYLFDPTDTNDISKKIIKAISSERSKAIGKNLLRLQKYDLSSVMNEIDNIYNSDKLFG